MNTLIATVRRLQKGEIGRKVNIRLKEFEAFKHKPTEAWFSELCFCLLTANAKFKTAFQIQKELGHEGFMHRSLNELIDCIKRNKHRFHNNKAKFIIQARKHINIKDELSKDDFEAREFLVQNIKGLGYKESSHFLRNVGYKNLAILDRHILRLMKENKLIRTIPTMTKKNYLKIEKKFNKLADKLNMSSAELDLYMWYLKVGDVLK